MTFEFVVACNQNGGDDPEAVLTELLRKTLQDNLNEFDADAVRQMISLRHHRSGSTTDSPTTQLLVGFTLELPDGLENVETVVDEFSAALSDSAPICHAVRFENPLLQTELERRSREIFVLEMKLRRVLTFIYLNANGGSDPYDLLHEEAVQPLAKERVQSEVMKSAVENEFFHLTFGQYVGLNTRPDIKLPALLDIIHDQQSYDAFRDELARQPVKHEDDAILLAGLKEKMDAIETMRNCVAHNRKPSKRVTANYENARPILETLLDDYLKRWELNPEGQSATADSAEPQSPSSGSATPRS